MSELDDTILEMDETTPNMIVIEVDEAAPEADGTTLVVLRPEQEDALILKFLIDDAGAAVFVDVFLSGVMRATEAVHAHRRSS